MIDEQAEYRLSQQSHLDAEWKCLQGYLPPLRHPWPTANSLAAGHVRCDLLDPLLDGNVHGREGRLAEDAGGIEPMPFLEELHGGDESSAVFRARRCSWLRGV